MRKLSTAIFVLVRDDAEAVKAYHASGSGRHTLTPEELQQKDAKYWNTRCRRLVRSATELKRSLKALMDEFADARDPELGNALLFTPYTQQVYDAVLELINSGSFCGKDHSPPGNNQQGLWGAEGSLGYRLVSQVDVCWFSAFSVAPDSCCSSYVQERAYFQGQSAGSHVPHMADKPAAVLSFVLPCYRSPAAQQDVHQTGEGPWAHAALRRGARHVPVGGLPQAPD